jgi:hypothetical protein
MLQTLTTRLSIAAAMLLALGATAASGATRTFTINSADIVDLYSATFDGALTSCGATPTQECTFFGGNPPAPRAIVITPTGTGTGTMNVTYNDATGEITQVNSMIIHLPAMTLLISPPAQAPGNTLVTVTPGNGFPVTANGDDAFVEAGTGTTGRDLNGLLPPVVGSTGAGTADPDQAPATGQFVVFQHSDPPQLDTPDFAWFSDIVDSCVDTAPASNCGLIQFDVLSLDGIRYRLEGGIGCRASGHSLVLKTQTANNSIYRVNLTVTANDADCDGDTLANALDNCPDVSNVGQADGDGDGRGNACDNCRTLANNSGTGAQVDSDDDGFGNRCDGDFNQNNVTNSQDYVLFRAQIGAPSVTPVFNRADINTNGVVNSQDYVQFRGLIGSAPGPGAGP